MEPVAITPGQYIQHHLEHLTLNLKTFTIGEGGGFWTLNLDTMIISVIIGFIIFGTIALCCNAHERNSQANYKTFVEIIIEFVNNAVHEIFHHKTTFIPSLALDHLSLGIFYECHGFITR